MIKTVGIDPGLAGTGVGIVTGSGFKVSQYAYSSISTSKSDPVPKRLDRIYTGLLHILAQEQPECMVVEAAFSLSRYPKSAITLGQVTGIILLAGHQTNTVVRDVSVREVKQILTGNGNAGKQQLEKAVRNLLKAEKPIRPYHASDALALALVGLFRYKTWRMEGR